MITLIVINHIITNDAHSACVLCNMLEYLIGFWHDQFISFWCYLFPILPCIAQLYTSDLRGENTEYIKCYSLTSSVIGPVILRSQWCVCVPVVDTHTVMIQPHVFNNPHKDKFLLLKMNIGHENFDQNTNIGSCFNGFQLTHSTSYWWCRSPGSATAPSCVSCHQNICI